MRSVECSRLIFMVNDDLKVIIIRPVGFLTGRAFVHQLFQAYARVDAPWTYNRLNDFRRFEGEIGAEDLQDIAERWQTLACHTPYHAHVAVVSQDPFAPVRVPAASPLFPNETLCPFTDYHEALGWLCSQRRDDYLAHLPPVSPSHRPDYRISIS